MTYSLEFLVLNQINFLIPIIGIVAGLHAACYGAYKDTPYESFYVLRYIREITIGFTVGLFLTFLPHFKNEPLLVLFLTILALDRIITEFYKQFVRVENQDIYLIPTQVHFFREVINNRAIRILIGALCAGAIYLIYSWSANLPVYFSTWQKGIAVGLLTGLATAVGGGYKDGLFEGFDRVKFFRSPIVGALGGFFVSHYTDNLALIFFSSIGFERMLVELYKGFLKPGYSPGKFLAKEPIYPTWLSRRKKLIPIYTLTWIIFLALLLV